MLAAAIRSAAIVPAAIRSPLIDPATSFGVVIAPSAIIVPGSTGRTAALSHQTAPALAWNDSATMRALTVFAGAVTVPEMRCQVAPSTGGEACTTPQFRVAPEPSSHWA